MNYFVWALQKASKPWSSFTFCSNYRAIFLSVIAEGVWVAAFFTVKKKMLNKIMSRISMLWKAALEISQCFLMFSFMFQLLHWFTIVSWTYFGTTWLACKAGAFFCWCSPIFNNDWKLFWSVMLSKSAIHRINNFCFVISLF